MILKLLLSLQAIMAGTGTPVTDFTPNQKQCDGMDAKDANGNDLWTKSGDVSTGISFFSEEELTLETCYDLCTLFIPENSHSCCETYAYESGGVGCNLYLQDKEGNTFTDPLGCSVLDDLSWAWEAGAAPPPYEISPL